MRAFHPSGYLSPRENVMTGNDMVPTLMFGTLGITLIAAIGALLWFLRKRSNRNAYKRATGIDEDAGQRPEDRR